MRINRIHEKIASAGSSLFGVAVIIALIFTPMSAVYAHKVFVYAWHDGGTIYTESYFGAKRKVKDGLIRVFDLSGKKLLEGRTNEQGEFSFKCPQKTDLRIVLEASMGHKNECILKAEELSDVPSAETEVFTSDSSEKESIPTISTDKEMIKAVVEQVLDSRLKSIKKELAAIRNERSIGITEIIGGIGYIFGIMGLIMYFKSRKP
jgi:nickel transport protein